MLIPSQTEDAFPPSDSRVWRFRTPRNRPPQREIARFGIFVWIQTDLSAKTREKGERIVLESPSKVEWSFVVLSRDPPTQGSDSLGGVCSGVVASMFLGGHGFPRGVDGKTSGHDRQRRKPARPIKPMAVISVLNMENHPPERGNRPAARWSVSKLPSG